MNSLPEKNAAVSPSVGSAIWAPAAKQHKTAGPYSPVLEIDARKLVVISGQAPLDLEGNVIGNTIERQAKVTLENCRIQLGSAGCDFSHVFKVNVYLTDLDNWERFNSVYVREMVRPFPARTAVQAGLLSGFLVEIEMWAAKP